MAGEANTFLVRGRSSSLIHPSFPINITESTTTPGVIGEEEQEATSMGYLLCDIFSSHNNMAATSPQDLFGILDLLEAPQEASKFISLIEESSSTCNNRDADNNMADVSNLKLPVLEQEPEMEPHPNQNSNTFAFSNVDHHGSSEPTQSTSVPPIPSDSAASELLKNKSHKFTKESNKYRLKSEACQALLQKSTSLQSKSGFHTHLSDFSDSETETIAIDKPKNKRHKAVPTSSSDQVEGGDGPRMTHIAVERNRRKQMNEHLAVLRSLMPGFYVQRGDQASIIGGVIEFIKELQQLLQSLESKKQRKVYAEVLSPRPALSPRTLPISPRTPQPTNSYRPKIQSPFMPSTMDLNFETVKELVANSKSAVADVEVKIAGSNALLKTLSHRIPGQVLKLVQTLENLSLEILHLNISTIDDTVLNSFTLKIGIECKLSVEELAQAVQQTFSC